MANKQPAGTKVDQQKSEKLPVKGTPSVDMEVMGQHNRNLFMEQALEMPEQARADVVKSMQHDYGNYQIRRIFDPQANQQPLVNSRGELSKYVSDEIQRARSGGSGIPADLNRQMGSQMGDDFSRVRIHTDRTADSLAGRLQANAFTIGNNIFFRQGGYAPHTSRGRFTLMHELTHVMQQSGSTISGPLKLGPTHDRYEQEANHLAAHQSASTAGSLASAQAVQGGVIQREGGATTPVVTPPTRRPLPLLPPAHRPPDHQPPPPPVSVPQPVTSTVSQAAVPVSPQIAPPTTAQSSSSGGSLPAVVHPAPKGRALPPTPPAISPAPRSNTAAVTPPVPKEALKLGMTQTMWSALSNEKRGIVQTMLSGRKDVAQQLIYLISSNKWPKDGSNTDINSAGVIKSIPAVFMVSLQSWNAISDKYRRALLDLSAKPYVGQLGAMAKAATWPRKTSGDDIFSPADLEKIINFYHIPFEKWNIIPDDERNFLETIPSSDNANARQLGAAAISLNWPVDNLNAHLSYTVWLDIKKADTSLTPENWNKIDTATRQAILSATTDTDRKSLLRKVNYKEDKLQSTGEKVQKFLDNPIVDALSGGAGTSSSIAQAAEGENPVVSASIGVGAAGLDTAVQSLVMAGSISRLVRGQRMAGRENASRAARALGRKERREGMWGVASSTLGLGGSISSMVSSSSKLHDNEADKESGLSGRADKASGSFALATGALGMTRGGIGLFKGFSRSSSAGKFVKTASATGDEKTLSDIADFTAQNQNRLGKGMETAKSAFTSASGISNIVGGTGGGISAAVFGGLGLLTGIANAVMGKIFQPKEADLNQKTDDLISLWRKPYAPAIQFAKDVLKISEPDLVAWVDEDPEAAKDLIKSKLSKY